MKKFMAGFLTLSLVMSFSACGNPQTKESSAEATSVNPEFSSNAATSNILEQEYNFNIGSSSTAGSTTSNVFEAIQGEIGKASGGKMNVTYYGASALGTDSEMLTECQNGNLPLVIVTTASLTNYIPEMGIFDMPCTVSSMEQFTKLFNNAEFMEALQGWFSKAGLRLVAWDTSASKLLAATQNVQSIKDFSGMDLRTLNNRYQIAFWKGLGANTIQIDASEIYLSMQQGLIDGVEFSMSGILSRNIPEVCSYVIETMDLSQINMVVMSDTVYQSMTEADKAWFDQYMAKVSEDFTAASAKDVEAGWSQLESEDITCIRFQQSLFEEMKAVAEESCWPLIREELGDDVVDFYLDTLEGLTS